MNLNLFFICKVGSRYDWVLCLFRLENNLTMQLIQGLRIDSGGVFMSCRMRFMYVCGCEWARVGGRGARGAGREVSTRAPRLRRASHLLPWGHGKILFKLMRTPDTEIKAKFQLKYTITSYVSRNTETVVLESWWNIGRQTLM